MTCASRHWYAVGVRTGVRSPTCVRCGHPDPDYTEKQRAEYEEYMADIAEQRRRQQLTHEERNREDAPAYARMAYRQLGRGRLRRASVDLALAFQLLPVPDPGRPLDIVYREKGLIR